MLRTLAPLIALVLAAGCIQAPNDDTEASEASVVVDPPTEGRITAEETQDEKEELCLDQGIQLPNLALQCVTRTTLVKGEMDVDRLPIALLSPIGDVEVLGGEAGKWSLEHVVRASGATADQARSEVDRHELEYAIEDETGYRLSIRSTSADNTMGNVDILVRLTLPPMVAYALVAEAGSADMFLHDLETEELSVETGSGDIGLQNLDVDRLVVEVGSGDIMMANVKARTVRTLGGSGDVGLDGVEFADASFETGSGDVVAILTPTATGKLIVSTGSGDVELGLPESKDIGYDLTADTGSGDIEIGLEDGTVSGDEEHKTFTTNGFGSRTIRTTATVSTGSGDIMVGPPGAAQSTPIEPPIRS